MLFIFKYIGKSFISFSQSHYEYSVPGQILGHFLCYFPPPPKQNKAKNQKYLSQTFINDCTKRIENKYDSNHKHTHEGVEEESEIFPFQTFQLSCNSNILVLSTPTTLTSLWTDLTILCSGKMPLALRNRFPVSEAPG